ncbi:hypothetical protein [Pseudomarimonas salicorniae]|uniref:Uncharacterized protein n=1 Tax=Pseudomarimonas salicorniae TaxID=2933270 RepID=A0ABT0GEX5_9GAMM|nr:hypothetical protein [Lysobacter sp. CAU 1642]MCK7592907.1 hypothetical protein [Lysobacter sp. CAU 1642]
MASGVLAKFASEYQAEEFVHKVDEISARQTPVMACDRRDREVRVMAVGDAPLKDSQTDELKALAKDFQALEVTRLAA